MEGEGRASEQKPLRTRTAWGAGGVCRLKLTKANGKANAHTGPTCVCRDEPSEVWLKLGVRWQAVVPPYLLTFTGRVCFEVLWENEV